jgi:hypothetical protein
MLAKKVVQYGVIGMMGWVVGTHGDRDLLPYPLSHFDPLYFSEDHQYLRNIGYERYVHKGMLEWTNPNAVTEWKNRNNYFIQQLQSEQTQDLCNQAVRFDIRFLKDIDPRFFNQDLIQSALESMYGDHVWDDIDSVFNCVVGPVPKEVLEKQLQEYYSQHEIALETKQSISRLIEEDSTPRPQTPHGLDSVTDYTLRHRTGSFQWWK